MLGEQLFVLLSALVINLSELGFVYLVISGVCPRAVCMPAQCSAAELQFHLGHHKGPL